MRAIEVAGVDVSDTEFNNLAQDRECTVVVCWRPEYVRTSQLHGTVPHAGKDQIIGELERARWQCCRRGRLAHGFHVRECHRKPRRWRCNGTFIRNACLIPRSDEREPRVDPIPARRVLPSRHSLAACEAAARFRFTRFYVASPIPLLAPVMTTTLSLIT